MALQFRFKGTHEDEIFLEEGEHKFHQAHVIAEHIMKLLFRCENYHSKNPRRNSG